MIDDMILRTLTHAPLTTKGSELTWEELDQNWIELFDNLAGIRNAANVSAWSELNSYYEGEFVTYDGKLYEALTGDVPGDNEGNLPDEASSLYWQEDSAGQLLSSPGQEPVKSYTLVQLEKMKTENRLIPGGRYQMENLQFLGADYPLILTAASGSTFYARAISTQNEGYIIDVDTSDADSDNWFLLRIENYPVEINLSQSATYNPTTKALTITEEQRAGEVFELVADPWSESTAYEEDDVVEHNGSVYVALMATTDDEPGTSPTAWELIHGTGYPEIETINDLSSSHDSKFEVTDISVQMNHGAAVAGNIILDLATNVLLTGYGFIKLRDTDGINRKEASGLLN